MFKLLKSLLPRRPQYDVSKIHKGMTKAEVKAIFGPPNRVTEGWILDEWDYFSESLFSEMIHASISFNGNGLVLHTYRKGPPVIR